VINTFTSSDSPASAFVVEELSGERRVISLLGRALPYRPIELSGTMRATTTFYAGNPIGTLQVLGAQEEPTTISGFWKDRFIQSVTAEGAPVNPDGRALLGAAGAGDVGSGAVADVRALVALFDDVRRKGQLLEVRWDQQVRRGFLQKFGQKWHNPHDCEWEASFSWISQGEDDAPPVLVDADLVDVAGRMAADARELQASALQQVDGALGGFRGLLNVANDFVDAVAAPVAEVVATAQSANDVAASGVRALTDEAPQKMIALLQGAIDQPNILVQTCQRASRNLLQDTDPAAITPSRAIAMDVYLRGVVSSSRRARRTALDQRQRLRSASSTEGAVASVRVRAGEDLRTISTRFYGTPDEWRRILQFNPGLTGSEVPANTVVLVPPASRTGGAALGRG